MLWIWQLSHLGDSEARLFRLGSKARLVVSHFLLVLPVLASLQIAVLPFIIEEMAGTAPVVLSVEDPQES